jgi:hypothetical protein
VDDELGVDEKIKEKGRGDHVGAFLFLCRSVDGPEITTRSRTGVAAGVAVLGAHHSAVESGRGSRGDHRAYQSDNIDAAVLAGAPEDSPVSPGRLNAPINWCRPNYFFDRNNRPIPLFAIKLPSGGSRDGFKRRDRHRRAFVGTGAGKT